MDTNLAITVLGLAATAVCVLAWLGTGAFLRLTRDGLVCALAVLVALPALVRPGDLPARVLPWERLDLNKVDDLFIHWKLRALDDDPGACRKAIERTTANVEFMPDMIASDRCHIRNRVRLNALSAARLPPVQTRCAIAARLFIWEQHVVQPAARRHLGTSVVGVRHFSSYACRGIRTDRGVLARMSEHATANAFDISGFRLADADTVSVLHDWGRGTAKSDFLDEVHDGLCAWFNVTLGPAYNRLHADHFHVDMGPFRSCR